MSKIDEEEYLRQSQEEEDRYYLRLIEERDQIEESLQMEVDQLSAVPSTEEELFRHIQEDERNIEE